MSKPCKDRKCDCGKPAVQGSIFCKRCMNAVIASNKKNGLSYEKEATGKWL